MITKLDVAEVLSHAYQMRDFAERIIDLLVPNVEGEAASGCPHPHDKVNVEHTMDDDPSTYTCTLCGATQTTPFLSEQ